MVVENQGACYHSSEENRLLEDDVKSAIGYRQNCARQQGARVPYLLVTK